MVRHHFNETSNDVEPIDWDNRPPESGLGDRMVKDGIILDELPESVLQAKQEGLDIYFSTALSGSPSTHGSAIASGTGRKLWLLVSPELQCKWAARPNLLAENAGLPPICDETRSDWGPHSKYHHESKPCMGQLHPLDIVRRIEFSANTI